MSQPAILTTPLIYINGITPNNLKQVIRRMNCTSNMRMRRTCRSMKTFITENMRSVKLWASEMSLTLELEDSYYKCRVTHVDSRKENSVSFNLSEDDLMEKISQLRHLHLSSLTLKKHSGPLAPHLMIGYVNALLANHLERAEIEPAREYHVLTETLKSAGWSCDNLVFDSNPSTSIRLATSLKVKLLESGIGEGTDCTIFTKENFHVDKLYLKLPNDEMHVNIINLFLKNNFCRELRTSKLVQLYDYSPLPVGCTLLEEITLGFLFYTGSTKMFQFDVLRTDFEEMFAYLTGFMDRAPFVEGAETPKPKLFLFLKRGEGGPDVVVKVEGNLEVHERKQRSRTRIRGSTMHVTYYSA